MKRHKNIYKIGKKLFITSDEEIKEGDWCIEFTPNNEKITELFKCNEEQVLNISTGTDYKYKKIILTTDQNLIKEGVQAIDDDFLEWYVKNPSCERVETIQIEDELISPKNPKIRFNALQDPPSFISAESLNNMILTYKYKIIIPKQETLEEDLKKFSPLKYKGEMAYNKTDMLEFYKWQQQQDKNLYSEEEVELIAVEKYTSTKQETLEEVAERIAENFAVRFAEWYADKIIDNVSLYYAYSAREFLQEFKKEKGL